MSECSIRRKVVECSNQFSHKSGDGKSDFQFSARTGPERLSEMTTLEELEAGVIDLTGWESDSETTQMRWDLTSDEDLSDPESGWEQSLIVSHTTSLPGGNWSAPTTSSNKNDVPQAEESIYKFTYNFGTKQPSTEVLLPASEDTGQLQKEVCIGSLRSRCSLRSRITLSCRR